MRFEWMRFACVSRSISPQVLALAMALSVTACGSKGAALTSSSLATSPSVVSGVSKKSDRSVVFDLNLPVDRTSEVQDHRWKLKNITQLDLILFKGGKVYSTATVFTNSANHNVRFSHLQFEILYGLMLVVKGNKSGNAEQPVQVLNTHNPATASILFSGINDVDNFQFIRLPIILDLVSGNRIDE